MTFDLVKWQGVFILFGYPMNFVCQNGIWSSQKWQGMPILCKYPKGLVGQNYTWPDKKDKYCLY